MEKGKGYITFVIAQADARLPAGVLCVSLRRKRGRKENRHEG